MKKKQKILINNILLVLFSCFLATGSAPAQVNSNNSLFAKNDFNTPNLHKTTHNNISVVGRWANGPCRSAVGCQNMLYFGNGCYLEIADITNPAQPVRQGKVLLPELVNDLTNNGYLVYVATNYGLHIIDASNPAEPQLVGAIELWRETWKIELNGDYIYALVDGVLNIIDVSDPANPVETSYLYDLIHDGTDLVVKDNYVYVAGCNTGLYIFDVTNPLEPQQTSLLEVEDGLRSLTMNGCYVYASTSNQGIYIIDVSNPMQTAIVGNMNYKILDCRLALDNNKLYFTSNSKKLHILDLSDPLVPVEKGTMNSATARGISVNDNYAFLTFWSYQVQIIDVSNLNHPRMAGAIITGYPLAGMAINNNYAHITANAAGLLVLDISNPGSPTETGYINLEGVSKNIRINGLFAYIADYGYEYEGGLRILDISNPSDPIEKGFIKLGRVNKLEIDYPYAYALTAKNLYIIDISNPDHPVKKSSYAIGGEDYDAFGLAVKDQTVLVALPRGGFHIIDVSDPTNPVGTKIPIVNYTVDVYVSGSYAFVINGSSDLHIIDISNIENPQEIGFIDVNGKECQVATISNGYAYLVGDWGLNIVDVSNPSSPFNIGSTERDYRFLDAKVSGNYIYATSEEKGIYVLRFDAPNSVQQESPAVPVEFAMHQNYPNPFNPTTTITYNLPKAGQVKLEIVNITGQAVATLVDGYQSAGEHSAVFAPTESGLTLPSGVYLCVLSSGQSRDVKKMTLLK